jgi:hypothetical protein
MQVFFKRLPRGTQKIEIQNFIASTVKGGLFSKSGKVKNIIIIERNNPQMTLMDYHAVINIEPDCVALRVIKKLNRKKFKDKLIEIRRYFIRNPANDPRNKDRLLDEVPDSRRMRERRQKVNNENSLSFVGVKDFSRKA